MSFQIQYTANLIDKISPELRRIAKSVEENQQSVARSSKKMSSSFDRIRKSAKKLANEGIKLLKSRIAGLVATIGSLAGITTAFRTLADFDEQMAKTQAVTKATSKEFNQLRELAKKLGASTEFTAAQAASGMAELGLASFSTTEILQSMAEVLDLATGGNISLRDAARMSSGIMRGFRIEAKNMSRVVDVMAAINSEAATDIGELGEAMKFVASIAEISNVSIEKTAAAVGVLSDNYMRGSLAGTGLRRIISELANPSRDAKKILGALGLTQKDVDIKSQGLVNVLKKLQPLTKHTGAAFKVFGDRGAPAFAILAKNIPKLELLIKKMEEAGGTGKTLANTMRDQLGGDFKSFKSSLEALVISIGDAGLTGALRSALSTMAVFFRALAGDQESFKKTSYSARGFINILRGIGSVIKVVFKTIGYFFYFVSWVFNHLFGFIDRFLGYARSVGDLLTGGLLGKALDKLSSLAGIMSSGSVDINQNVTGGTNQNIPSEKVNRRNEVSVNGNVGIDFSGLPKGSSVNVNPSPNNNINMGTNSLFAN